MWMNEFEIRNMLERHGRHLVLGPATHTLAWLMLWTNSHSDGWPYWQQPARAAEKLMDLVQQHDNWERGEYQHPRPGVEATPAALAVALRPIKAFRTRQHADFVIFTSVADIEAEIRRHAEAAEATERAELARLQAKYESE